MIIAYVTLLTAVDVTRGRAQVRAKFVEAGALQTELIVGRRERSVRPNTEETPREAIDRVISVTSHTITATKLQRVFGTRFRFDLAFVRLVSGVPPKSKTKSKRNILRAYPIVTTTFDHLRAGGIRSSESAPSDGLRGNSTIGLV